MKKVVAVLMTDPHLDKNNGLLVKSIFDQAARLCLEHNTENLICAGDIFTNRSGQPLQVLNDFKDIVLDLEKKNIVLHMIAGNHDKTDPSNYSSYLDIYERYGCLVYRNAASKTMGKVRFFFIPYFQSKTWFKEFLKIKERIQPNAVNVLVTHMAFNGVKNNDGSVINDGVSPKVVSGFDKVLVGHYHNASKVGDNIYYTGSCYQNNFGETITDKGFTLIYNDGTTSKVRSFFPKYIKEVVDIADKTNLKNLIEKYEGDDENFIRFVFKGNKADAGKINIGELAKSGIDCKFELSETSAAMDIAVADEVFKFDKKTIVKDFMEFCKENDIKGEKMMYGFKLIKELV